jgi:phosphoglycerol transferase MdoB-like AlkP superfamily enzyme
MPKLDSLWKHVGQRKAAITSMGVVVGDLYFLKTNQHVINEKLYVQRGKDIIWQQIAKGIGVKRTKNCFCLPFIFPKQAHD